jgi:hypothetical protein
MTRIPKSSGASAFDATIKLSARRRQSIGPRHVSHASTLSTSSSSRSPQRNISGDWRSPTPSLTDWGGITTATDSELETEAWDDWDGPTTETEVEQPSFNSAKSALGRRKSGLRMPSLSSLFKSRRKSTLQGVAVQEVLPPELRGIQASELPLAVSSQQVKIIPLRSQRLRTRTNSQTTETQDSRAPTAVSREATPDSRRSVYSRSRQTTPHAETDSEHGSPAPQRPISSYISPSASSSRVSFADDTTQSESEDTTKEHRKQKRRKLKRRTRTSSGSKADSSAEYKPLTAASSREQSPLHSFHQDMGISLAFPVPSPTPPLRPQPESLPSARRRPLSISLMFAPKTLRSESSSTLNSSTSTASSTFSRRHKPSASVSSIPTSPTSSFGSSLLARARAFSRTGPKSPLPSTQGSPLSMPSPPKEPEPAMPNSFSTMSMASTIKPDRFYSSSDASPDRLTISPSAATLHPYQTPDRRQLPPLRLVSRPGSKEQLYARTPPTDSPLTLASLEHSPSLQLRPFTADPSSRPNSYFTIGPSSSAGQSPGGPEVNGSNSMARRVSLSDLRIPTRITNAQAKIGQDLQRVRDFKSGVEGG